MRPDDDQLIARARARLSGGERLGLDRLEIMIASLTRRQRQVAMLMVEALAEGRELPTAHEVAAKLGCHYTSAKRTIDRLTRALAASVPVAYDIKNISRNNN